jgi:hypothetical protein
MLWTIVVILLVLWLLGFLGNIGGGLVHILLVLALIVIVVNLLQGRPVRFTINAPFQYARRATYAS